LENYHNKPGLKEKLIGRSPDCDLVLKQASVSRHHARAVRANNGRLQIQDNNSVNGIFLYRSRRWIRASIISLCREDTLRCGDVEVPAAQLADLFGPENRVWLPSIDQETAFILTGKSGLPGSEGPDSRIKKPRRNPVTGQIEENFS